MDIVLINGAGFERLVASQAKSFWERFRGLRSSKCGESLLLEASSIHTVGLRRDIGVIGIDDGSVVVGSQMVSPNRVCRIKGSRQILEVPASVELPQPGVRLVIRPV